ncbi:MAG: DNA mismatch repair endonuclease MutL [Lachnospiraceae bacterium]|nr:DNA mismatch repair endonuclease MutL [Lachnospiraceae bacterium]
MPNIEILDQQTIDKIAAGEVIERPASVVKELVENAIDAQSSAITVEIKEGGISFIRITDNGCGIEKEQVPLAFLRHSTSKIRSVEDLVSVSSLGFRGEALSSIAAVSQVELITKTVQGIGGVRYVIEGGKEKSIEEIGAPEGTTFLVRNLFYNTPARRKFLKTAQTEAGYIENLIEKLALSHPEISFKFISNNQLKLHTSGNSNLKDVIYHIYGRETTANLLEIQGENELFSIKGFIGKPLISRGNRNYETYFINGRYIKSSLIAKGIEEGYQSFVMQHKYPFTVLDISINGSLLDVNVHPTKMELRFSNGEEFYQFLSTLIRDVINQSELVYQVSLDNEKESPKRSKQYRQEQLRAKRQAPEPFETKRLEAIKRAIKDDSPYEPMYQKKSETEKRSQQTPISKMSKEIPELAAENADFVAPPERTGESADFAASPERTGESADFTTSTELSEKRRDEATKNQIETVELRPDDSTDKTKVEHRPAELEKNQGKTECTNKKTEEKLQSFTQRELFQETNRKLLDSSSQKEYRMIGQLFDTYWLVEFDGQLYIIDQHAAHEKVLYERTMKTLDAKEFTSQVIYPPILLTLNMQEESLLKKYLDYFHKLGFEVEHFGGKEYSVTAVPANLFGLNGEELMIEILDSLSEFHGRETPQVIMEKIASMSCKAAVKGNQKLSRQEIEALIADLLTLDNPYHCPHGRPTIISMSKYELEKKFKRVL